MPRVIARSGHAGRMLAGCRCGRYAATAGALGVTDGTNRNATGAVRRRARVRGKLRTGAGLSGKTGPHRGAVSGRRLGRHRDPRRHPEAQRHLGAADRHREQGRRRHADRRRSRREVRARRLHLVRDRDGNLCHHAVHARQAVLRSGQGLHAGQRARSLEPVSGRAGIVRSQERPRSDRAGQGQAGRSAIRHHRARRFEPHQHGAVREHGGREAHADPFPRRRATGHRPARRPCADELPQRCAGRPRHQGGKAPADRDRQQAAPAAVPGRADGRPNPACRVSRR